jgi:hypothetical protein
MITKVFAQKGITFQRIRSSIKKIRNHKQVGPTVKWIHIFNKTFKDEDLTQELMDELDWNCDNYKL